LNPVKVHHEVSAAKFSHVMLHMANSWGMCGVKFVWQAVLSF